MQKNRGVLLTILSAVFFGVSPVVGKLTFAGGNNGLNLAFLRALLSLPILYLLLRAKGHTLALTREQAKGVLVLGFFGFTLTNITLYLSYNYIAAGMATTLHFVYPLLVTLGCVVFYRERLGRGKLLALALGTAGVLLFLEGGGGGSLVGMVLAILSGGCYAFYILYMDRSNLKELYFFKLSFYLSLVMCPATGLLAYAMGSLTFALTPRAWFFSLVVSLLAAVGAVSLFQMGVRQVGASAAAILSTAEPITSVVLGVVVLGEELTVKKILGCACIVASVVLITLSTQPKEESEAEETILTEG